jgi:hypothetical protein
MPDGFRFAVKMPRAITMYGRVDDAGFCERVRALGDRLGPLLMRPPTIASATTAHARCSTASTTTCGRPSICRPSWDGAELLEPRRGARQPVRDPRRFATCACASRPTTTRPCGRGPIG